MKTIELSAQGSDGSPHGHGDCDWGEYDLEVSDEMYEAIKKFIEKGEDDLCAMPIEGLEDLYQDIIDEILSYQSEPEECRIHLYSSLPEEDDL